MAREGLTGAEFEISGMTCASCGDRIEKRLGRLGGVVSAEADYARGTARVTFDEKITSAGEIASAVESLGYGVTRSGAKKNPGELGNFIGVLLLVGALFLFLNQGGGALGNIFNFFPQAEAGMGYLALAAVGLLTSAHCVAMCGGINLSQSMSCGAGGKNFSRLLSYENFRPTILYNAGRVASYTIIGGAVGALGSAVGFSGTARGMVQIIAGIFMVIMGMNMLGTFGYLRSFAPRLPKSFTRLLDRGKRGRGPLYVGLLNGLMPCGPLQAMQVYALSSGSASRGALSMLAFSLGTVPLMFCLGAFGSLMSKKFAGRVMKLGAALVIVMGVVMFNNGTALSGFGFGVGAGGFEGAGNFRGASGGSSPAPSGAVSEVKNFGAGAVQEVAISLTKYGRYSPITVKAGVPVRWTIHADKGTINGCNNAIIIPAFNVQQKLKTGDTVVEFTPTKPGKYVYSCWMGMIRSTITVIDGDIPSAEGASGAAPAEVAEPEIFEDGGGAALPSCACCGG